MGAHAVPGRLIHRADFESLMSAPVRSRSAHFALHHVTGVPKPPGRARVEEGKDKLSTDLSETGDRVVNNSQIWIGAVVPKRHAKRAVTRNLLKRQIREAFARHHAVLDRGLWLVRLRQGFAPKEFVSARSPRLGAAARAELDQLLSQPMVRDTGARRGPTSRAASRP